MKTYTVRQLGSTSWVAGVLLADAIKAAVEARDRGLSRVVIVDDDTGEIVDTTEHRPEPHGRS